MTARLAMRRQAEDSLRAVADAKRRQDETFEVSWRAGHSMGGRQSSISFAQIVGCMPPGIHCSRPMLYPSLQAIQRDFGINAGEIRRVLGLWQVGARMPSALPSARGWPPPTAAGSSVITARMLDSPSHLFLCALLLCRSMAMRCWRGWGRAAPRRASGPALRRRQRRRVLKTAGCCWRWQRPMWIQSRCSSGWRACKGTATSWSAA